MSPLRNLLVHGINAVVREVVFQPTLPRMGIEDGKPRHLHTIIGGHPAVVLWPTVMPNEMTVAVWWDYNHSKHPQANDPGALEQFTTVMPVAKEIHYRKFLGGIVYGFFDLEGNYLREYGDDGVSGEKMRRGTMAALRLLPRAEPLGYGAEGWCAAGK